MKVLAFIGLVILAYLSVKFGLAGFLAGMGIFLFFLFGLVPIFQGQGITCGIGGIFVWFIGFVAVIVGIFLFERDQMGAVPGTYDPATDKHSYLADRILNVFSNGIPDGGFVSSSTSHGMLTVSMIIAGIIVIGAILAKITK